MYGIPDAACFIASLATYGADERSLICRSESIFDMLITTKYVRIVVSGLQKGNTSIASV